jgi:hypothetical protein
MPGKSSRIEHKESAGTSIRLDTVVLLRQYSLISVPDQKVMDATVLLNLTRSLVSQLQCGVEIRMFDLTVEAAIAGYQVPTAPSSQVPDASTPIAKK